MFLNLQHKYSNDGKKIRYSRRKRGMANKKTDLAQYYADKAEEAIDKLWEEGTINDSVIEDWKNEHMRTPYKQS